MTSALNKNLGKG